MRKSQIKTTNEDENTYVGAVNRQPHAYMLDETVVAKPEALRKLFGSSSETSDTYH